MWESNYPLFLLNRGILIYQRVALKSNYVEAQVYLEQYLLSAYDTGREALHISIRVQIYKVKLWDSSQVYNIGPILSHSLINTLYVRVLLHEK